MPPELPQTFRRLDKGEQRKLLRWARSSKHPLAWGTTSEVGQCFVELPGELHKWREDDWGLVCVPRADFGAYLAPQARWANVGLVEKIVMGALPVSVDRLKLICAPVPNLNTPEPDCYPSHPDAPIDHEPDAPCGALIDPQRVHRSGQFALVVSLLDKPGERPGPARLRQRPLGVYWGTECHFPGHLVRLDLLRAICPTSADLKICNRLSAFLTAEMLCRPDRSAEEVWDTSEYEDLIVDILEEGQKDIDHFSKDTRLIERDWKGKIILVWDGWESEQFAISHDLYRHMKRDQAMQSAVRAIAALLGDTASLSVGSEIASADSTDILQGAPVQPHEKRRGPYKQYAFEGDSPPPKEVIEGAKKVWGDDAFKVMGVPPKTWEGWENNIAGEAFNQGIGLSAWIDVNHNNPKLKRLIDYLEHPPAKD